MLVTHIDKIIGESQTLFCQSLCEPDDDFSFGLTEYSSKPGKTRLRSYYKNKCLLLFNPVNDLSVFNVRKFFCVTRNRVHFLSAY